jgi:CheY-like chemotaxis protein
VERLPRLLEPMGVRAHEARTGAHASRIIRVTPIHMAVVDLALPLDEADTTPDPDLAEGGPRLLELLSRLESPPPVVAVKRSRTHRDDARDIAAALRLGAFAVIDRPRDLADMNLVLDVLRRCLERHYKGCWPRVPGPNG